jgi:uncharacterized protein
MAGGEMAGGAPPDIAALAAALAAALRAAGLPAGPDRGERLASALAVMGATTVAELHACALATLVSGPGQIDTFERVFGELLGAAPGLGDPGGAGWMEAGGDLGDRGDVGDRGDRGGRDGEGGAGGSDGSDGSRGEDGDSGRDHGTPAVRGAASVTERLRRQDFARLSPAELARLAALMRDLVIAVPPRPARRYQAGKHGAGLDMRRTVRQAIRTGGEPLRIVRRSARVRPRRLVVLCDISGSMEPYARAILQLMYVAARAAGASGGGGPGFSGPSGDAYRPRTEVFSFATRLTRLTPLLAAGSPETMLAQAGQAAPDWAGGTRIGASLRAFNDRYAVPGLGRGAVILVISDGWETGDPALLGAQLARLRRIAYRIVWANPRTQSERYQPEVGGMAAAWPYCDAVVSAHNFEALGDLLAALRAPRAGAGRGGTRRRR